MTYLMTLEVTVSCIVYLTYLMTPEGHGVIVELTYFMTPKGHGELCGRFDLLYDPKRSRAH